MLEKLLDIRLLAFDMDGVLTNGKLLMSSTGEWERVMDIKDGYALQAAVKSGLIVVVLTGSFSEPISSRLKHLGITHFIQHVSDKAEAIKMLLSEFSLTQDQILYMGDDIPDIEGFKVSGFTACPIDAVVEIKNKVDFISQKTGGNGCVREIIEKVMRVQGTWGNNEKIQSI